MEVITLQAEKRNGGKIENRALRSNNQVPCVMYGHGTESVSFSVNLLDVNKLIYTKEAHRVKVDLDGKIWDCIPKDFMFHPTKDHAIHADFQILNEAEPVSLKVPVTIIGTSKGVMLGGTLDVAKRHLPISCLPVLIPSSIVVDITELGIGDVVHVSDLDLEGITFETPDATTIVSVKMKRGVEETDEEEGKEEEVASTEEDVQD